MCKKEGEGHCQTWLLCLHAFSSLPVAETVMIKAIFWVRHSRRGSLSPLLSLLHKTTHHLNTHLGQLNEQNVKFYCLSAIICISEHYRSLIYHTKITKGEWFFPQWVQCHLTGLEIIIKKLLLNNCFFKENIHVDI